MILQRIEKMGIAKKIAGPTLAGKPKRCLRRTSADLFCKRHSAQGHHRWKCCSCGRIFSEKTGSAIAISKLFAATGAKYAKDTLVGMSLKELLFACHVSLKDLVGSMHMRLFEVVGSALKPPRSAHVVCCQADGLPLDESLVGSRARSAVQMRDSTQATAILCTQAAYQV